MTGVIVAITNYYTSISFRPVRKIALASETGHATNIIAGLAVGQQATALPVLFICLAIILSYHLCRTLRDRDCGHEHAFHGRDHYFTRRLWPYHR